jgi:hypothetical protein
VQLSRLQMIVDECTRDLGDEGAIDISGYYRHMDAWWRSPDGRVEDEPLALELEKCLATNAPYRTTKSRQSNFALAEIQAVIRAEFDVPLKRSRLEATQRIVLRSYRNASNAFAVK